MERKKNCVFLKMEILFLCIIVSQWVVCESFSPYFFLCNYHGRLDPLPQEKDKLLLSVTLDENPEVYTPGEVYKVRITSSKDFNGLLITGLFSSFLNKEKVNPSAFGMTSIGFNLENSGTSDFVCGLVYSDYSPHKRPTSEVSFSWTAPSQGTGCVSFLLTASLGMQIVFQDVVAYQICEKGQLILESRPSLADIHSDGVILRDDFDSGDILEIWSSESEGVTVGQKCGEITHGNAAVLCGDSLLRQLITPSLNLTSASAIQFTTGAGSCQYSDNFITLSYQLQGEDDWTVIKYLSITKQSRVNVIQLPKEAKEDGVKLRFSEEGDLYVSNTGCWALDNVLISESENRPTSLHENMDPIDTSKWLFMPGGSIKGECMSQANAMVFVSEANDTSPTFAVTRDLNLWTTPLHGEPISDFEVLGGKPKPNACGHTDEASTIVFNEAGNRKICTTLTDNLQHKVAVQFFLSIGSAECVGDQYSPEVTLSAYFSQTRQVLQTYTQNYYKNPKRVIVQLPAVVQTRGAILCLEQDDNNGENMDVWAIDSFELIERQSEPHDFMQFSINMQCSSVFVETRVNVEYSNDFGRSWNILQQECLPETCNGQHWPYNSVYKTDMNQQWVRATFPVPEAALTEHTRFRWIQVGVTERETHWAIDNIFIGSDENCPGMCSGHGTCLPDGCRCDAGFHGPLCNVTHTMLPTSLAADFNSKDNFQHIFQMAYGSEIGYSCGMLGTGKALVFNGKGERMAIIKPHNGTNLKYLQFVILMGRHSSVGTCQAPRVPGDGVLVHYTIDRGMTWKLLHVVPFNSERKTKVVSIHLPPEATVPGLQVRWWQPNENQKGKAVWAIDDVILSSDLYKSIFSTPENYQKIYSSSVAFHTGMLTNYCNRSNVLLFSPQPPQYHRTLRYCETQTMETSGGYVLEADLILQKCDRNELLPKDYEFDQNHELLLQYSKDEGVTWHLVQEEELPGSTATESFHPASIYHVSEFRDWTTAVLPMPKNTWSSSIRLRIVQNEKSDSVWALDSVYMGPACDMHCRNRGKCRNGQCSCNADSVGPTCLSRTPLPSGVHEVFDDMKKLFKTGWNFIGGFKAASAIEKEGCGSMPSEHYLHFNKAGVRKLSTPDLDTSMGGQIQFYIRIGGGNCKIPSKRANGVLLQFSNNGGITWDLLDELYYEDYEIPKYVHRDLPIKARTKQTRFQWWQPRNSGKEQDQWSLSDVIVGEPMVSDDIQQSIKLSSRRSTNEHLISSPKTFILLSNDGQPEDFCDSDVRKAHVFNKLNGDRFAVTDDLYLRRGDTIQFEINIACSRNFSWNYPVHLEFSHNEGYSWELVTRVCYPNGRPESQMYSKNPANDLSAHDCTGVARELTEASVYYEGDYETWRRIVISVPERITAMPVRLRWWQQVPSNLSSNYLPSTWAIRSIHIGPSCPEQCSGHGTCTLGIGARIKCMCDEGYTGESCSVSENPISRFWDHFTLPERGNWWDHIIGLSKDASCGEVGERNSLYFGNEGTRFAKTKSLDTTGIRLIEFYLRLGSDSDSEMCFAPERRDETIVLQYSNNNGITWHLIKELNSDAYSSRSEKVRVDIPYTAKTPLTSFRWWQPLQEQGERRSQWALDDVFVGVPDLLSDGFTEDFENEIISDTNWYKVAGGHIESFTHCDGSVEPTEQALVITKANGVAETWDFHLSSGTFLQFDVVLSCESDNPANDFLSLEYSTDMGETWQLIIPSCMPSTSAGCDHGHGSVYYAALHQEWKRQTVALPEALTSITKIRFRWIQYYFTEGSSSWAIDNIYLGNGCPWMCSGHGKCWSSEEEGDSCKCDPGFSNLPFCQPSDILPSMLMDSFDQIKEDNYIFTIGKFNESSELIIKSENLKMGIEGIRMLQTRYLNATEMKYIQFYIAYPETGDILDKNRSGILVLQSTKNGGISWSTIHLINTANLDGRNKKFVHVLLPDFARHEAVSFRLWQANTKPASPIFGYGEEIWAIDNLLIGGKTGCEDYLQEDNFDVMNERKLSKWLFKSEKEMDGGFCDSNGNAFVINKTTGLRSIETNDLCISENYVVQFKIAIGCPAANSHLHGVRLEYSIDHGITWSLLQPLCHQNIPTSSGCSNKYHPPSIYYPGTHSGWRRFIIPLANDLCGSVRFRWYQGFYEDEFKAANAISWGLDEVYIGPACDEMCNGHGICTNEGETCDCDHGFEGQTCCDISTPNPELFKETFDNEDGIFDKEKNVRWETLSGGNIFHNFENCDDLSLQISNWNYRVEDDGQRILETRDLDMRNAQYIQFYLTFHLNENSDLNSVNINGVNGQEKSDGMMIFPPVTDALYLQFSNYGGIEWNLLETFPFSYADLSESRFIVLHLPEEARTNATRFRWWHPMEERNHDFGFTVDHIVIGASKRKIDDEFKSYESSNWIEMSSAEIQPGIGSKCCSRENSDGDKCDILEVGSRNNTRDCNSNFIISNGVDVKQGSYISFNLNMNCEAKSNHCEDVELQYSIDLGKTWLPLVSPCLPNNAECTHYYQGSKFYSDVYAAQAEDDPNNRIIVPIPEHARSPSTRFRWFQKRDLESESWSLDNMYIGNECPGACFGHGRCIESHCVCDEGWEGYICQTPTEQLPIELKEIFSSDFIYAGNQESMFTKHIGGEIDKVCGEVGFEYAFHFFGSCSRLLESVLLDTTKADFVQFMFRSTCGKNPPANRDQGVLVDYTTNGGAVWHNLAELYYKNYNGKPSFVNILLPEQAKIVGTQFRWWQPKHDGLNHQDWAIDNILISGKKEDVMLSDDFNVAKESGPAGLWFDRGDKHMWQFYDNTEPNSFCGRNNVILAGTVPGLDTTVSTKDFIPEEGYMMQYTIVVLCEDVSSKHEPVHVQYSTDFGDTWQYLRPQCIPSDRDCFGKEVTQPSAHFIGPDWQRNTIWIPESLYGQPVRFRFHQKESDVKWALDRLFIGPSCPDACSAHGDCVGVPQDDMFKTGKINYDARRCLCDFGYEAPNCYLHFDRIKYLKDDFNTGEQFGRWFNIIPHKISMDCGVLVDGYSLTFSGVGPRQAVTVDLDLRDARFVQHNAVIGNNEETCLHAKQRQDGVLLQYSTDSGITWHMLHELDYASFGDTKHEYIELPLAAKTNATRIRWWQPYTMDNVSGLATMGEDRAGWSIDNVYIGGQEVNADKLEENFEIGFDGSPGNLDERKYEFYPNGQIGIDQCFGDDTSHMMWPGTESVFPKQSFTTRQLIISPGHMIQFKIKVGCGREQTCSQKFPVKLEYREDPRYGEWHLVKPICFPSNPPSPDCPPYIFHDASLYKLEYNNIWKRITIPLNHISSDTTQFRWYQDDNATDVYSWAIDDLYIGESCPSYCSGHGQCTKSLECICDDGFIGIDCSIPRHRYVVPVFRDDFEHENIRKSLWHEFSGGTISAKGCGPLKPYGFSRSVYFHDCGMRQLISREVDLRKAWRIQYVLQFGSIHPNKDCRVYDGGFYDGTPMSMIVLQYTTNNGITWHTLREHSPPHYGIPRRVAQSLPTMAKTTTTRLRWWQPEHRGEGFDQWAVDNVDIIMTRRQNHLNLMDYYALLRKHRAQSQQNTHVSHVNRDPSTSILKRGEIRPVSSAREQNPPEIDLP